MAEITYEDKTTGGEFTADDANEIKNTVNANSLPSFIESQYESIVGTEKFTTAEKDKLEQVNVTEASFDTATKIESMAYQIVKSHNPYLNPQGIAMVGDATPANVANNAYYAGQTGTIFGISVTRGQILINSGSGWGAYNFKEYIIPSNVKNSNPNVFRDRETRDLQMTADNGHTAGYGENTIFDYVGNMYLFTKNADGTGTGVFYIEKALLLNAYADPNFTGQMYILVEMACSINKNKTIFVDCQFGTGSIIGSNNIPVTFKANAPTSVMIPVNMTDSTRIRLWVQNSDYAGETTYIGRIAIFTNIEDYTKFRFNQTDRDQLNQIFLDQNKINSCQELSGFYQWRTINDGIYTILGTQGTDWDIVPNTIFPYEGNMFRAINANLEFRDFFNIKSQNGYKKATVLNGKEYAPITIIFELQTDVDGGFVTRLLTQDSTETAEESIIGVTRYKANERKIAIIETYINTWYDSDYIIKFEGLDGNMHIGRMAIYNEHGVDKIDDPQAVALSEVRKHQNLFHPSGLNQFYLGDSLTVRMDTEVRLVNNDVSVTVLADGGKTSTHMTELFLQQSVNANTFYVIWLGRNNKTYPREIVTDVARCVQHIKDVGSQNYLIMGVINGDYVDEGIGEANYLKIEKTNTILKKAYGSRFFDVRNFLIQRCDMGALFLNADYIQPSVGSTVQVSIQSDINNTSFFSVGQEIVIGDIDTIVGTYTVASIDSATLITLTLDTEGSVLSSATVTNPLDSGGTYNRYKQVMLKEDRDNYLRDIPIKSWRADDIHQNSIASYAIAYEIRNIINGL